GMPTPTASSNPFKDVKSTDYFYNAVMWAVGKGVTAGTDSTHFSPNVTCTRWQVVTFLFRDRTK
ncbi:MAG: S-layer homology domain-containing protein, partial [Clostridia bacterium]|nr:S-layer homology domain-containing protein [Clostridia bacterium]